MDWLTVCAAKKGNDLSARLGGRLTGNPRLRWHAKPLIDTDLPRGMRRKSPENATRRKKPVDPTSAAPATPSLPISPATRRNHAPKTLRNFADKFPFPAHNHSRIPLGGGPPDNPPPQPAYLKNVDQRVKSEPKSPHNSFGWRILLNNSFIINNLEWAVKDQTAENKDFKPKKV